LVKQCVFCSVPQKFHLCCCDSEFVLFFSAHVSLPYSTVGIVNALYIRNLVVSGQWKVLQLD
jgi:hypothetical protein